ncbi:MAG: polyprenyl synthetase family protein [Burkholderiaceae bacterium]|jgi:octaprenyl-diphosphate synthase|nr:polyprenyl synthetase family protein [Burkholderiaceae bacterium]
MNLPESGPLDEIPASLVADMQAVDRLIHEQLRSDAALVTQVGEHLVNAGGKRIRPLLVLLMARALNYQGRQHHTLAAIIEFIHTASLLHDDVVDESARRRGVESANARFGNAASVLVGDFMHTRAFQMMLSVGDRRVMEILAEAANAIAEGEVMQLMRARQSDVDEAAYFHMIDAKTARLFEAACALGARIAVPDVNGFAQAAAAYGRSLGIAFQLIDDCLDYAGEAATLGKPVGNDLREGKMTLPLIWLMHHGAVGEKNRIRDYIEHGEKTHFEEILHSVRQSGALSYVSRRAEEAAGTAASAIAPFPDSVCKDCLMRLTRFAVSRSY